MLKAAIVIFVIATVYWQRGKILNAWDTFTSWFDGGPDAHA